MSASWAVFLHEWTRFWRTGIVLAMVAIVSLIGVASVIIEQRTLSAERNERQALREQEIEQWLDLGDAHIHKAAHRGFFVIRELPPGALLDRGVLDFGGAAVWLEAHRRNAPQLRAIDSAGLSARGMPRGLGPVLLWLTPLLLVVLLHGIVARERASGSLAFSISLGASPAAIVLGKTGALISLAWIAALLPMVLGLTLAIQTGLHPLSAATWAGTMLTALGLFAGLVVAVSSVTRSSLAALVALLLIWFAMVVLWPRLAPGITQTLAPIPSSQVVRSEAEVAAEGLVKQSTERAIRARLQTEGIANPNPSGVTALAAEIDAAEQFERIFAPLETRMMRQVQLLDGLSWLSPLAAADRWADSLLGVSDRDQFAFEQQAEASRMATQRTLNEHWARMTPGAARGTQELWRQVVDAARPASKDRLTKSLAWPGLLLWLLVVIGLLKFSIRAIRRAI